MTPYLGYSSTCTLFKFVQTGSTIIAIPWLSLRKSPLSKLCAHPLMTLIMTRQRGLLIPELLTLLPPPPNRPLSHTRPCLLSPIRRPRFRQLSLVDYPSFRLLCLVMRSTLDNDPSEWSALLGVGGVERLWSGFSQVKVMINGWWMDSNQIPFPYFVSF